MDKRTSGILVTVVALAGAGLAMAFLRPPSKVVQSEFAQLVKHDGSVDERAFQSFLSGIRRDMASTPNTVVNSARLSEAVQVLSEADGGHAYVHEIADVLWNGKAPLPLWTQVEYGAIIAIRPEPVFSDRSLKSLKADADWATAFPQYFTEMLDRNPDPLMTSMFFTFEWFKVDEGKKEMERLQILEKQVTSEKGLNLIRGREWKVRQEQNPAPMKFEAKPKPFDLSQFKGKAVAVALVPGETPQLDALRAQLLSAAPFIQGRRISFVTVGPWKNDQKGPPEHFETSADEKFERFGVGKSPEIYFFDKDGELVGTCAFVGHNVDLALRTVLSQMDQKLNGSDHKAQEVRSR